MSSARTNITSNNPTTTIRGGSQNVSQKGGRTTEIANKVMQKMNQVKVSPMKQNESQNGIAAPVPGGVQIPMKAPAPIPNPPVQNFQHKVVLPIVQNEDLAANNTLYDPANVWNQGEKKDVHEFYGKPF